MEPELRGASVVWSCLPASCPHAPTARQAQAADAFAQGSEESSGSWCHWQCSSAPMPKCREMKRSALLAPHHHCGASRECACEWFVCDLAVAEAGPGPQAGPHLPHQRADDGRARGTGKGASSSKCSPQATLRLGCLVEAAMLVGPRARACEMPARAGAWWGAEPESSYTQHGPDVHCPVARSSHPRSTSA